MTEQEAQVIRDRAEAAVVARLRAIMTSPEGIKFDPIATYIAFETSISAEEALKILEMTRARIGAAAAAVRTEEWARVNVPAEISIHSH